MAEIVWPDYLPVTMLMEGLTVTRQSNIIRTQMDAGPGKTRRRYTASVKRFAGKIILNESQRRHFDEFYRIILADGVLRFNFTDPQTLETGEFRFAQEPVEISVDGLFEISMSLERL